MLGKLYSPEEALKIGAVDELVDSKEAAMTRLELNLECLICLMKGILAKKHFFSTKVQRDSRGAPPDAPGGESDDQDPDETTHHRQVREEEGGRCGRGRVPADGRENAEEPWSIFGITE